MKLLIAGSRNINNIDISEYVPDGVSLIICGGAAGIDTLAEKYADKHRISKLVVRPEYEKYGRAAPLKRNSLMVDMADIVLVIWDGKSKGSQYTINYAKRNNKKITVVDLLKEN